MKVLPRKVPEDHAHAHELEDAETDGLPAYSGTDLHRCPRQQHDNAVAQVAAGEPGGGPRQEDKAAADEFLHEVQPRGEHLLGGDDPEDQQVVEKVVHQHQKDGQRPPGVQDGKAGFLKFLSFSHMTFMCPAAVTAWECGSGIGNQSESKVLFAYFFFPEKVSYTLNRKRMISPSLTT